MKLTTLTPKVDKNKFVAAMYDISYTECGNTYIIAPGQCCRLDTCNCPSSSTKLTLYNCLHDCRISPQGRLSHKWYTNIADQPMSMNEIAAYSHAMSGWGCGITTYDLNTATHGLYVESCMYGMFSSCTYKRMKTSRFIKGHITARAAQGSLLRLGGSRRTTHSHIIQAWLPKFMCEATPATLSTFTDGVPVTYRLWDVVTQKYVTLVELPIPFLFTPFDALVKINKKYNNYACEEFMLTWRDCLLSLKSDHFIDTLYIWHGEEKLHPSVPVEERWLKSDYNLYSMDSNNNIPTATSIADKYSGGLRRWVRYPYAHNDPLFGIDDTNRYTALLSIKQENFLVKDDDVLL